jgi:WD40 repeat protein
MLILRGHTGWVRGLAYSPDGRLLASGGADHFVRLWHLREHIELAPLPGHPNAVVAVAFAPDGSSVASIGLDNHIRLWDVTSGRERAPLPRQRSHLTSVAFFPDGAALAVSTGLVTCMAISPDGKTVAAGSGPPIDFRRGAVMVWDLAALTESVRLELTDMARWSAFYPRERLQWELGGGNRVVKLWEPASERRLPALPHRRAVGAVAFSPDGATLASAAGQTIKLWDVATGRERRRLKGHGHDVYTLSFTPDGTALLSGGGDRSVRLWDVASGRQRTAYSWPVGKVFAVAVSPDGLTAAAAGDGPDVVVWDLGET